MNIQATIQQLGGKGKLKAMVGATHIQREGENAMSFRFKGSRRCNLCIIALNGSDEYDVTFMNQRSGKKFICETVTETVAWAGNLKEVFEQETGLYLSL